MNKLIPALVLSLILLTPVHTTAQVKLPAWKDITKWCKKGDWFYYKINVIRRDLNGTIIERATSYVNITVEYIDSGMVILRRHVINTGDIYEEKHYADKYYQIIPFLLIRNVSVPEKKFDVTMKLKKVTLSGDNITVEIFYNMSFYTGDIILANITATVSYVKSGLTLEYSVEFIVIRKASVSISSTEYKTENGLLLKTNVDLTSNEEEIEKPTLTNYIVIPLIIATIAVVIAFLWWKRHA